MKLKKIIALPIKWFFMPYILSAKSFAKTRHNSKEVISGLLRHPKSNAGIESENREVEKSFKNAVDSARMKAENKGEDYSIDDIYKSLLLKKRTLLTGMYFIWSLALSSIFQNKIIDSVIMTIAPFSAFFFLYIVQFRMWQIEKQRLTIEEKGSMADFNKEVSWITKCLNPQFRSVSPLLLTLAIVACIILIPHTALAASFDDLQNAANSGTDLSKQGLYTLFGEVVNDPLSVITGTSDTFISQIFKVFGGTLLIVATAMAGYISLKTVGQSAHDGQFLSGQQHSLWMPIRVLSGFSMLVPMGNGWSLSQLLMLYGATVVGIGSANYGQEKVLDAFTNGQSFVMQPVTTSTNGLAHELFKANLCMYGINASLDKVQSQGGIVFSQDYINQFTSSTSSGFTLRSKSYSCGGAELHIKTEDWGSSSLSDINTDIISAAHKEALTAMQTTLMDGASKFVQAVTQRQTNPEAALPNAESLIQAAAQTYENTVTSALRNFNSNTQLRNLSSQIGTQMKSDGWWGLGSWYQNLAVANTRITNISGARAKAFGSDAAQVPDTYDLYLSALKAFSTQQTITQKSNAGIMDVSTNFQAVSYSENPFSYVLSPMMQNLTTGFLRLISVNDSNQVNPLIALKNFGDYVSVAAEGGLTIYVAAKAAAAGIDNSAIGTVGNFFSGMPAAVKEGLNAVSPFIIIALSLLFSASFILIIYLPLLPFIIWFSACLNWLIVVAEAIFAAPLWAFTHLQSEGDGMGPKTAHGYIFLLNVMVRPILMVGGFFLGGGIVVVGGTLLMKTLPVAIANAQYDSTTGIVSAIGLIVLFCSLGLTLVNSAFCLINIIPDQVINWVGGQAASHLGREMESNTKGSTNILASKSESMANGRKEPKKTGNKATPAASAQPPKAGMKGG